MSTTTMGVAGLGALLVAATAAWVVSVRRSDASIADICWGPGFALLAWVYVLTARPAPPRALLLAALVTVWALRLSWHIARRHRGEDPRYAAMRKARGSAFRWQSLFIVFWLQAALMWVVSLPILAAAGSRGPDMPSPLDVVGLLLFGAGFSIEAVGDAQLARFRADPSRRGQVLDSGLWRYTRHPNYFGDALLWWGLFLVSASAPGGWRTLVGPALMTLLLLRVSGVSLLEPALLQSKPAYADYVARTPAFFPWVPRPATRRAPTPRRD